jgi:hypothetical protein
MKKSHLLYFLFIVTVATASLCGFSQVYRNVPLKSSITGVQPMTGIVFWSNNLSHNTTDIISLEFSYMKYSDVVKEKGIFNWDVVEEVLDAAASRQHQAILRFRFIYPGDIISAVPEYIRNLPDYHDTLGISERRPTMFADWRNQELQEFTLDFYTRFAEKYDKDPRLAFLQVGFGLWAEYHIYDGIRIIGRTFPSKEFQETFLKHLGTVFSHLPWSISVDAANGAYSPFESRPYLKNISFGLFDDSFMHRTHHEYNTDCWNFFGRQSYRQSPAGGEFSYYSRYDQRHVLDYPDGPYGKNFETFAKEFHITYMIGNDQPQYQSSERIREASMVCGYRFRVLEFKTSGNESIVRVTNTGIAPIYRDAYVSVDGVRAGETLKYLQPGQTRLFFIPYGFTKGELRIESDHLVSGQRIEFEADLE